MSDVVDQDVDTQDQETVSLKVDNGGRAAFSAALCGTFGVAMGYGGIASYAHAVGFVPVGIVGLIASLVISTFFLWATTLNVWRLVGPDYDAVVSPTGLILHPSVAPRPIGWERVSASRVVSKYMGRMGKRTVIELQLTHSVVSLSSPIGSKRVSIIQGHPSYPQEMKHVARLIRKYRRAAGWAR